MQEALLERDPQRVEPLGLRLLLDPLGHHRQPEGVDQPDDARDEARCAVAGPSRRTNERSS